MQSQVMVLFATLLAFITCVYGVPTPLGLTEGLEVRNSTIEKRFAGGKSPPEPFTLYGSRINGYEPF